MRRQRFPWGKAACATRWVSSGIAKAGWGWSNTGVLVGKDCQVGPPGRFSVGPGSSHNCKAGRKMEFATSVHLGPMELEAVEFHGDPSLLSHDLVVEVILATADLDALLRDD